MLVRMQLSAQNQSLAGSFPGQHGPTPREMLFFSRRAVFTFGSIPGVGPSTELLLGQMTAQRLGKTWRGVSWSCLSFCEADKALRHLTARCHNARRGCCRWVHGCGLWRCPWVLHLPCPETPGCWGRAGKTGELVKSPSHQTHEEVFSGCTAQTIYRSLPWSLLPDHYCLPRHILKHWTFNYKWHNNPWLMKYRALRMQRMQLALAAARSWRLNKTLVIHCQPGERLDPCLISNF